MKNIFINKEFWDSSRLSLWWGVLTSLFYLSFFLVAFLRWYRLPDISFLEFAISSMHDWVFYSAIYLFSILLLYILKPSLIVFILTYGLFVLALLVELLFSVFYKISGMVLDANLLWFGLQRFNKTFDLLLSQVSLLSIFLSLLFLFILALPLIWWSSTPKQLIALHSRRFLVFPIVILSVGGMASHNSVFKRPSPETESSLMKNPSVHLAVTYFENKLYEQEVGLRQKNKEDLHKTPRITSTREGKAKNIVIIILESTRARSVTPFNKSIKTTPFLDSLSKTSLLADNAYSIIPHTSKAVFSILCGLTPKISSEIVEASLEGINVPCLPSLLKESEYESVFFQAATKNFEQREQLVKNMGFDDFIPHENMMSEGYQVMNSFGFEDDIMLPASQKWLEKKSTKPFLATYLTVSPHFHIIPNRKYGWNNYDSNKRKNNYLNALNYLDNFVKNIILQYKKHDLYEDTLFVIVGDHGESFKDEHNIWGHGNLLYEEGIRVPLIIHDPKHSFTKSRVEYPVDLSDVLPTIIDHLGYSIQSSVYTGRSLIDSEKPSRELYFNCIIPRICAGSLVAKKKYIHYFGRKRDELFDLIKDPYEQKNLLSEVNTDYTKSRLESLLKWRSKYLRKDPYYKIRSENSWPVSLISDNREIGDKKRGIAYEKIFDLPEGQSLNKSSYFLNLNISNMTPSGHEDIRNKQYETILSLNGSTLATLNHKIKGKKRSEQLTNIRIPISSELLRPTSNQLLITPGIYKKSSNYDDFDLHSIQVVSPFFSTVLSEKIHLGDNKHLFNGSFFWPTDVSLSSMKLSISFSDIVPNMHIDYMKGYYQTDLLVNGHKVLVLNKLIAGTIDSPNKKTLIVNINSRFLKKGDNVIAIRAGHIPNIVKYDNFTIHGAELTR